MNKTKLLIFFIFFGFLTNVNAQGNQIILYKTISDKDIQAGLYQAEPTHNKFPASNTTTVNSNFLSETIKKAIKVLEDSMKSTCAEQMVVNLTVTAEGKWVIGVSLAGSMTLTILNPDLSKSCKK